MSSEHKKPLFALVVITVACCVFMGYTLRANALAVLLPSGAKASVTALAEVLTISPKSEPEASASPEGVSDRGASTAPATVVKRSRSNTAEPVARPGFGKPEAKSHQVRALEARHRANSRRSMHRAAKYRQHVREPADSAGSKSHSQGRARGHGREHAPGQNRPDARKHGAPWNRPGSDRGQRGYDRSHHTGKRAQDRGRDGYDRSHHTGKRSHDRGNRGHHGNRGNRGHHRGHGRH